MLYRVILPKWRQEESPELPRAVDGEFTDEQLADFNCQGYNIHWFPNYPSRFEGGTVDGSQIDRFEWVFVDFDLKSNTYPSKEAFLNKLRQSPLKPSRIIDSGNGIHAFWRVLDLDPMSFLRLQRRLMRFYNTDEAVAKILQLMRVPGYANTKAKGDYKLCELVEENVSEYTSEQLNKWLPRISQEDEAYCKRHYDLTAGVEQEITVSDVLPAKFSKLLKENEEVVSLYSTPQSDRSKADYRLAHILFAQGFTRDEALSVLVNCRKALERSPSHRVGYALGIVDKVWVAEQDPGLMSNSVRDILRKTQAVKGERFPCWELLDGTNHGFHLTEILGLIGGSGSGKTTLALNYFRHFAARNPNYIHLFVSLEQPESEIAVRWARMSEDNENLNDKVHVLGNYNEDGSYRNLSLSDVESYVFKLEKAAETKVGCVVIDHIGALKKKNKDGENQGLIDICLQMKAVANNTKTFIIMQSQTNRQKAGIGDVELDKDAAYGTTLFEWFCDYIVTTWQPLKRVYDQAPHMTCSAFKYCKIRHKNVRLDKTKEDVVHVLMYDPDNERLRMMNQKDEQDFEIYNKMANNLRNKDRKREPTRITKIDWVKQ